MSVDKSESWSERSEKLARQMRLDTELARFSCSGMTNAEKAERLSEDLRPLFWRRELDAFFEQELR